MWACLYLYVHVQFMYAHMCACMWERGGWVAEVRRLSYWDISLCLPLLSRIGTATCPNCKEDERIKELEFGCHCNEEKNQLWLFLYLVHLDHIAIHPDIVNQHTHLSIQDIMKNQTLLDWFVVSGVIHFELDWDSKDEMKIEERGGEGWKTWERMGGRRERQEEREMVLKQEIWGWKT